MSYLNPSKYVVRRSFGKLKSAVPVPNLIEVQSKSFNDFVQLDYLPTERMPIGLEKVLRDIFPIDYEGRMSLEYVSYQLGDWLCTCGKLSGIVHRYTWSCTSCNATGCSSLSNDFRCPNCKKVDRARYKTCPICLTRVRLKLPMSMDECRSSGQTFALPLRIVVQLVSWNQTNDNTRTIRDIKEQEIFLADAPVMGDLYEENDRYRLGDQATFLINGIDRVVVSQMHRSPGVVFSRSKKASDVRGRPYYLARIIPMRGSWIDFEFDANDLLYVRIDKKRKLLATTFLQALGIPRDQIINRFYESEEIIIERGVLYKQVNEKLVGQRIEADMIPKKLESTLAGRRITKEVLRTLKSEGISRLALKKELLFDKVFAKDVVDKQTGEIIAAQGEQFNEHHYEILKNQSGASFEIVASFGYAFQPTLALTLAHDQCMTQEQALKDLHQKVWPGDSASIKDILQRLNTMFFAPRTYDLTRVGRLRMNRKLGLTTSPQTTILTLDDIVGTMRYLVNLRERGEGELDDIDHLGNRRVRLVGELLSTQFYVGFSRIERIARERFRVHDLQASLMPQDLLNVKPLSAVLREFFGTGQLSQFMDQTNPLSELAHKRRLSALGPGGVMKDRATYEVRDVHTSHYGRICPIETPEGQTIGLISSLATYAMVNDLGFIESAYRPVKNGKIIDEVVFLDAFEESNKFIAQADAADKTGNKIENNPVLARYEGNFINTPVDTVEYIDLSPKQLVSVAAALIPFLEHDDASRALMGANMQRQAVPLVRCQSARVGTGMETEVCKASGAVIQAKRAGTIAYVSAEKIIVRVDEQEFGTADTWLANGVDIYHLRKFERSSFCTWIHQTPIVTVGEHVVKGQVLTNGAAIKDGELALGSNLLVAFMPWHGYNFEDAIVLNKRLVTEDALTSVHIDEYVVEARDTKLGPEEITRDIPNVSEKALAPLDEDGVIKIGSRVRPGDILVGKVTLKGDVQYSPEEKLLRAIFGEKSREVRDTSLRVPPGIEGTVVDVKVFSRSGIRKDKRYKEVVTLQSAKIIDDHERHVKLLGTMIADKALDLIKTQKPGARVSQKVLKTKNSFDIKALQNLPVEKLLAIITTDDETNAKIKHLAQSYQTQLSILENLKKERINELKKGDVLPSGVIKMIKVYVASKRHIQVGDKLAGRHGNKGVVSIIVPREDMPYLDDGRAIDIVLNPIGVPSRMNIGQILETLLAYAGVEAGRLMAQSLEEKSQQEIYAYLENWYGKKFLDQYEDTYGKQALKELAHLTAQRGLYFSTPVFDGASFDDDIQPLLKKLNLSESGAYNIRDGRTGEYFQQPVTIGSIYMMKLNHMVDDKLHSRSVGPYSLVTQQPLGGKAQFGGQRFGEMEVWALEAYGAAYTLQEMLTYKSDDVTGRHKVYETIVRGDGREIPDPGLPESFNVLIKELQSLALQVDLFKGSKEEISE
jgi:DNA-directed RNA polymerase subunit beta